MDLFRHLFALVIPCSLLTTCWEGPVAPYCVVLSCLFCFHFHSQVCDS